MIAIVLLLCVLGFLNAFYLYYQHQREVKGGSKMFCLIGGDCSGVVSSKYGKTLGIKNEITGMAYYFLLAIFLLLNLIFPQTFKNYLVLPKAAALIAGAFSIYLLIVQTVILRKLCSWCLIAIAINFLIFYFLTLS